MDPSQPHFGLYMTMIGMGTVFTALILLSLFTLAFNRIFARADATDPETATPPVDLDPPKTNPPATTAAAVDPVTHAKRKRAAAIAVAVLLAARPKHIPLFRPASHAGAGWRQTYRQRFLTGRRR